MMATKVESIVKQLGAIREGLIEQGYTPDQAFWLVQDLVRNGAYYDLVGVSEE